MDPQNTWRGWLATILFLGTCVFPAQGAAGFFFNFGLGLSGLFFLALVGGALSGLLFDRGNAIARIFAGAIMGPCAALAIYHWIVGRQEIWTAEVVIVGIVAALPGIGVGFLLNKVLGDPTTGAQSAYSSNPGYQGYPPAANSYQQNSPSKPPADFTFGSQPNDQVPPRRY